MNKDSSIIKNNLLSENDSTEDVDFMAILKTLWSGRKTILITLALGTLLGVFVAILTPQEFTVTTVMVPQVSSNSNKSSQLSSIAALAGVEMGISQVSDLSPIVYPHIVNSVPFKLELMNTPINFNGLDHPVSIYDYYTKYSKPNIISIIKKYTFGLPAVLINALKNKKNIKVFVPNSNIQQPIQLTKTQYLIKESLDLLVSLNVEKKDGYLTLTVRMPEAMAAAQLAQKAQELLQRDITKFKIEKTKADLNFIQGRYDVAKTQFESVQVDLASVTDRNRDLTSGLSTVQRDRVQTRYTIAYSVYQDLAKQLEQAKIQVKKETPVFAIIEPVSVPTIRSSPNRIMILITWIIVGGLIGVSLIYGKSALQSFRKKWENLD